MCDYSLRSVKNRLAIDGEQLFINKFHTGSKGLASATDMETAKNRSRTGLKGLMRRMRLMRPVSIVEKDKLPAVCVPPGARLRLSGIPKRTRNRFGVSETEDVTFTQVTQEPFRYRDAFRFSNSAVALLQIFAEGVQVKVLALALEEEMETIPHSLEAEPVAVANRSKRTVHANV